MKKFFFLLFLFLSTIAKSQEFILTVTPEGPVSPTAGETSIKIEIKVKDLGNLQEGVCSYYFSGFWIKNNRIEGEVLESGPIKSNSLSHQWNLIINPSQSNNSDEYAIVVKTRWGYCGNPYIDEQNKTIRLSEPETPNNQPNPPTNLEVGELASRSFVLSWNPSIDPDGDSIEYMVYKDDFLYNTRTKNPWLKIASRIMPCKTYQMRVKAIDSLGAESSLSSPLTVNTPIQETELLNNDYTTFKRYDSRASNEIKLIPGFIFKAIDNNYLFSAKISNHCSNYIPVRNSLFELDSLVAKEINLNSYLILTGEKSKPLEKEETDASLGISIHPNPNNGYFRVILKNSFDKIESIDFFNMAGVAVYKKSNLLNNSVEVDLTTQPSGVYLIKVQTEKGTVITTKIIKQD